MIFVYPLFSKTLIPGHDTYFHLCRIEALKNAYQHGDFLPKLYYYQNFNFGYATPLFYSDLFLIVPSIIRLTGTPIVITFKIFLFLCTVFTFMSMYYAVYKINKNRLAAYLSAIIYVFTAYRITDVYVRGAMGEVVAMIFIPLILAEIYSVLYTDNYSSIRLGICFGLLLLSHNITFVFMCVIFGIFIIINCKKILKDKRRIFTILKAIIIAFGCLAFFIFPMFEQLNSGNYTVNEFVNDFNLSNYTLFFKQLFTLKINFGLAGHEFGESMWMTTNTGLVSLFLPLLMFKGKKKKTSDYTFALICTLIGFLSLFACLDIVPWDHLNKIFSFMQFPWRLVIIASSLLSFSSGIALSSVLEGENYKYIYTAFACVTILIGVYQLSVILNQESNIFNNTPYSLIADDEYSGKHGIVTKFNQAELALGDYLPKGTDIDYRNYGDYIKTNNEKSDILDFHRNYNNIEFAIEKSSSNTFYILPLTYYKGYIVQCYDQNGKFEKEIIPYPDQETYLVTFNPGEQMERKKYIIYYKGTKIQFISNGITLLFIIVVFFQEAARKFRKSQNCQLKKEKAERSEFQG